MSSHDHDARETLTDKGAGELLSRYRVVSGAGFKLADYMPDDVFPADLVKTDGVGLLERGVKRLSDLQERLYANGTWSVLVVLQAMDAAGKDSTIKHVLSGVNPQGVAVTSFKAPSSTDLAHDFLWRISHALPGRGMIGVFNRSHYEDVLVARVHPELLAKARLPEGLADDATFWDRRLAAIAAFERHLANEGTRVIKIYLNVSRAEQKARLLARLDEPEKLWKFDAGDLKERTLWPAYRDAYQAAIAATATHDAPWYIVPADRKWFARLVVIEAIIEALQGLDLHPPVLSDTARADVAKARAALEAS